MKMRYYMMVALLAATSIAQAQDTYLTDRLTATDDIDGTARFVGMGGALGALGADISAISSNPAAIGLYRKSDIALTFGAYIPQKTNGWSSSHDRANFEKLARASFDQMGFVWSMKVNDESLNYLNIAFNYQKKANYNMGFYADNLNLNGLSQMDLLSELATEGYDTDYNLTGMAIDNEFLSKDDKGYYNPYRGQEAYYTRHQRGAMQAYDLNFSFNIRNRVYVGATLGMENGNYYSWSSYSELSQDANGQLGDYTLYNDRKVDARGINAKFGMIVRPAENCPFRIGLTLETPTWYRMKQSTLYDLTDDVLHQRTKPLESYIEYTARTPWRGRLSLGSTVENFLAWGIEYEFANMAKTRMGYPSYDNDGYHNFFANTKDHSMNQLTERVMRGQHTLRVGLEAKPVDAVAIRVGYNFVSNRYKKNPTLDQYNLDSKSMNYYTSTDYMTLGAANIFTFGLGFKHKKFYADLAYKYKMQDGKFYAFDTSFAAPGSQFATDNSALAGATIQPTNLELNRHQLMLTLGFKL